MSDDVVEIQKKLKAEFAGVEKSEAYVVVSRYGFKKVEVDGKFYLEAMTKDEADTMLPPAEPQFIGYCATASAGGCVALDGCGYCQSYIDAGRFMCGCTR